LIEIVEERLKDASPDLLIEKNVIVCDNRLKASLYVSESNEQQGFLIEFLEDDTAHYTSANRTT